MVDPSAICWGPLLLIAVLFSILGILWAIAYPLLFLYGAVFSGRNLEKRMNNIVSRERASIEHFGKDPLSTLKGAQIVGGIHESGIVYSSVVYSPSHWQLLIAGINQLFGGSVSIIHRVIAVGRAEATQRLREQAQTAGWEDVLNVRIDTAEMTPSSVKKGPRAVEIFAYGTGVRYG
ncbi:MAG TPA: heavy metal-binding domain-containing protein [Candidatus Thalassarchaeaceae archaeon]|nr:heavy metal-binding domain-containing protein [Candidatus Thalassarchaeaceae archaeon]